MREKEMNADDSLNAVYALPLLSLAPHDLVALAEVIKVFLAAMRQRLPPSSECEAAFERLERLQKRLSLVTEGVMLAQDDITALEAAMVLFSTFLYLKIPPSEKRAWTLDALWEMREHLAGMRRTGPPGLN